MINAQEIAALRLFNKVIAVALVTFAQQCALKKSQVIKELDSEAMQAIVRGVLDYGCKHLGDLGPFHDEVTYRDHRFEFSSFTVPIDIDQLISDDQTSDDSEEKTASAAICVVDSDARHLSTVDLIAGASMFQGTDYCLVTCTDIISLDGTMTVYLLVAENQIEKLQAVDLDRMVHSL